MKASLLFADRVDEYGRPDPKGVAEALEGYKAALALEFAAAERGETALVGQVKGRSASGGVIADPQVGTGRMISKRNRIAEVKGALDDPWLQKAFGPDLASIAGLLDAAAARQAELFKDITTTSPIASGLVPIDLEAPAKFLVGRPTPLRNRIPRLPGRGLARVYKRITSFSGGTGGSAAINPGIVETTQNSFALSGSSNNLFFHRGPKIAYSGDQQTRNYKQNSLSSEVSMGAQFAGLGFQDVEQLDATALLYTSMLSEERLILGGRGTDAGQYVGSLAAPAGVTATARAAGAGEVGVTVAGTYWVQVTSDGIWGDSVPSAVVSVALTSGQVADVTVGTDAQGTLGYRVYANGPAASDPGTATRAFQGRTGYKTFTLFAAAAALLAVAPFVPAVDTSASALNYDGILTVLGDPNQTGYNTRLNAAFSSTTPGNELEAAFAALWDPGAGGRLADPEEALFNGRDRKQLSDLFRNSSATNYRVVLTMEDAGNGIMGTMVSGIYNEVTGSVVKFSVHPWLPQGNVPILSYQLPFPDTQVSNAWEMHGPQDFMMIRWPQIQFAYESSSYWFNALIPYAPAWNGMIQGIKLVN